MRELEKIFEEWSTNHEDTPNIAALWMKVEENLPEAPKDLHMRDIHDYILDYTSAIEEYAFIAGYKKAVMLLSEIFLDIFL